MHRLCDKKNLLVSSFWLHMRFPDKQWDPVSQLLEKLADQHPTVNHAAYVMLHDLVDIMILTCFHKLKIASDDHFYLLLEKTTSI